jgi:hypothetical protein
MRKNMDLGGQGAGRFTSAPDECIVFPMCQHKRSIPCAERRGPPVYKSYTPSKVVIATNLTIARTM